MVFDVTNISVRGHIAYQFRAANPDNVLLPFITAGGGVMRVVDTKNDLYIEKDMQVIAYAGVGLKYRAAHNWGIRGDLRVLFTPKVESGFTQDLEGLVSVYREWGRPGKKAVAPPPVKEDPDPDKDGVLGIADKCATDAEDKDSFQDDDGCPDPDNDGDGVPDAADKCADQPETKNGFQDDDGCPDEIPEKLKAFTGVIQGITFKVSAADLQPQSAKVLDKAIAVLTEFKDIKLEIQGHTDDQPLKGSKLFADNQALSQARAESVKAYFVSKGVEENRLIAKGYGDTQPVEAPTGLKGGKLAAARAKNRRVEFKLVPPEGAAAPAPAPAPAPKE